jgi:hypothetical protein
MGETLSVETTEGTLVVSIRKSTHDSAIVVSIDTPDWEDGPVGPKFRLWINDDLSYAGVPLVWAGVDNDDNNEGE